MAKRGRRSILGRPTTGAERTRRYRWTQALFKGMCDRWRTRGQANWTRDGEPDMIALQLADANFDAAPVRLDGAGRLGQLFRCSRPSITDWGCNIDHQGVAQVKAEVALSAGARSASLDRPNESAICLRRNHSCSSAILKIENWHTEIKIGARESEGGPRLWAWRPIR
jgi:hypothetical protein